MPKRSDHAGSIARAEQILCQPVGGTIDLESEPSLVAAYFLVAVLCDDEHMFVAESHKMKWNIRLLARYLGFSEVLTRNAVKSCRNANLYDSRGFHCYNPSRLETLSTLRLTAIRSDLLGKLRMLRTPIQLLPFEARELSWDQKETLRQLILLDHQTRLFMRDILEGKQRRNSPEAKQVLRPLAAWHNEGLAIVKELLV